MTWTTLVFVIFLLIYAGFVGYFVARVAKARECATAGKESSAEKAARKKEEEQALMIVSLMTVFFSALLLVAL